MNKPFHHLVRGIFVTGNKVLLAQAKGQKNTLLPGGHVEFGERADHALLREIEEELGIQCTVGSFLGMVEHKWEKNGILNVEWNQIFELKSNDLSSIENPLTRESHLEFFWCDLMELDDRSLQPYLFRHLIKQYVAGNRNVWWESSLHLEIDDSNRN